MKNIGCKIPPRRRIDQLRLLRTGLPWQRTATVVVTVTSVTRGHRNHASVTVAECQRKTPGNAAKAAFPGARICRSFAAERPIDYEPVPCSEFETAWKVVLALLPID